MKKCTKCGEEKSLDEFYKREISKDGKRSFCKECEKILARKFLKENRLKYPIKYLINGAKHRAKKKGIPFDLTENDLKIPEICLVFKKPFIYGCGRQDFSPSIDRIDNTKGYLKDNVIVVSMKANQIKNNATIEELQIVANFYKQFKKES